MTNIVLVAGTFHGGWYWNPIVPALQAAGHAVYAPTLSGLDPEVRASEPINLDKHINDVLKVIDDNQLEEVMLVGWSYGGMAITGIADRTQAKVVKLVYLDGQLPMPGQNEWSLMPALDRESMIASCFDGVNVYPDPWIVQHEPRVQPFPLGAKLQPLDYEQTKFDQLDKVFVFAEKWFHNPSETSPIEPSYLRAKAGEGWRVQRWPFGHDLVREAAQDVTDLLLAEALSI